MVANDPRGERRRPGGARAQAELVGIVLLIGLVITGSVIVVTLGRGSLGANEKAIAVDQAQNALTQLDARSSDAAFGFADGGSQTVSLGLPDGRGSLTTADDSWLRITLQNASTGANQTVVNQTLGTVRYQRGRTTVAYEGGGIWRSDGDGSVLVSQPEFHYRNRTLTVPILSLRGDKSLSRHVTVSRDGTSDTVYPNATRHFTNGVTQAIVTVTVHSDYYRAWGRYLGRTTHTRPRYDDENETVTVAFVAVPPRLSVAGGIVGTTGAGDLTIRGGGTYTDSYDSTQGYAASKSADGTIVTAGNVSLGGSAKFDGSIRSGGRVTASGTPTVTGRIEFTDGSAPTNVKKATFERIDGVPTVAPVDAYVYRTESTIRRHNTNASAGPTITDGNITISDGTHVLHAGQYAVDTVDVSGGKLVLNTTDGDIYLAVRDWMRVTNGDVVVKGNGTVSVFVASRHETTVNPTGKKPRDVNFYVGNGGHVRTDGHDATQFLVFAPQDFRGVIAANSGKKPSFDGLVYAPAGKNGCGDFYVKQGDVYGGVVSGSVTLGEKSAIHYDQALERVDLPRSPGIAQLGYMHVSVHRVNVTAQ